METKLKAQTCEDSEPTEMDAVQALVQVYSGLTSSVLVLSANFPQWTGVADDCLYVHVYVYVHFKKWLEDDSRDILVLQLLQAS